MPDDTVKLGEDEIPTRYLAMVTDEQVDRIAEAADLLRQGRRYTAEDRAAFRIDLGVLKLVARMAGWQPRYVYLDPSQERLAETVLKLEREVYGINRPHQLARRDVFLRIGEPIDLGRFVAPYLRHAQAVRQGVAEQLCDVIQALINAIPAARAGAG
jgi:hypothetical protein